MAPDRLAALDPRIHQRLDGDLDHSNYNLDLSANYRDFSLDLQYSRMNYGAYFLTPSFDDCNRIDLNSFHAAFGHDLLIADGLRLATRLVYSREDYDADFDFIVPDIDADQSQGSRRLDIEADLDWSPNENLGVIAGYRHRRLSDIRNRARIDLLGVTVDQDSQDIRQNDVFIQADYRPLNSLKLVAGLRWSHTDARRVTRAAPSPSNEFPACTRWTPCFGAIWSINPRNQLKLLYGEAQQDNGQVEVSEAETIATWEINWLNRFEHGSVQLSHVRKPHRSPAAQDPVPQPRYRPVPEAGRQLGPATHSRVELIARLRPVRGLDWSFSASWQDTDDLKNVGIAPGYSPHWLLKSQLSYRIGVCPARTGSL